MASGADGSVCSPREVSLIRDALGEEPMLVVPGIRPVGAAPRAINRASPRRRMVAAGADWIVVGRPITGAADPAAAARAIATSLPR